MNSLLARFGQQRTRREGKGRATNERKSVQTGILVSQPMTAPSAATKRNSRLQQRKQD